MMILFKTGLNNNGTLAAINNNGFGDAKGIEFFWRDRKTIKNVDYWISYSYLDTKRDFLNYPFAIEPSFAAKHTASLVVKKFVCQIKNPIQCFLYFCHRAGLIIILMYDNNTNTIKYMMRGEQKIIIT